MQEKDPWCLCSERIGVVFFLMSAGAWLDLRTNDAVRL
jgi:hypothetical protein